MRLMSVFCSASKDARVPTRGSERCDRDVWTGIFAHECSVNHSWSNLGECVRRCVEVALTEMGTRNFKKESRGKGRPTRRADNIATICWPFV
jgi:hypothetical protein